MGSKTTSFSKGKGKNRNFENGKPVVAPMKKPKVYSKLETEYFSCEGNGHWERNYPRCLVDKEAGNVNKSIFDIHVIDVCLTSAFYCS